MHASNTERMVFCLRYVDDNNLEVHEDTLGFYNLERTDAAYIMTVLQDTLLRFNLHISNCRGQCYDGAGNMAVCDQVLQQELLVVKKGPYFHIAMVIA